MQKPLHYLLILMIIIFGVASGNLLSNYISAQYVAYQASMVSKELREQINVVQAKQVRAQRSEQAATEEQRKQTTKGKRLRRSCDDWKKAHIQFDSNSTKLEMQKSCDAYVQYVTKGY
ncbi:hypothetical protein [Amphritea japonica]|uniref:hypothetical protein n=1 Tax=Amphritea japonica TaxID=452627 RepID=UPI0003808CC3|nr:hypothetical protein [Amphritea japonica]